MEDWLLTLTGAAMMVALLSAIAGDSGSGKAARLVLGIVFLGVVLASTAKLLGGLG
ncbi:MAG: hypothetical protein ACOYIR_05670 [Christensenellales bacterium]|jgi:hypothetical protein